MADARAGQELDRYLTLVKGPEAPLAQLAKSKSEALGKAQISISRADADLLQFLVRACGCRKFVEVGTLTGYSALAILAALPELHGELWTCEREPRHIEAAKAVFAQRPRGGPKVHLLEGDAVVNLKNIESFGPFDGMFIDANKAATGFYIDWARKNLRAGGLIVCDNTLFHGQVFEHAFRSAPDNDGIATRTGTAAAAQTASAPADTLAAKIHEANLRLLNSEDFEAVFIPASDGMIAALKRG